MPGKMPHIMGDHEPGFRTLVFLREVFRRVAIKTNDRADEGEVVEEIAANRRVFRRAAFVNFARLGFGRNDTYRPAAHSAGAELEISIEAVVQFAPCG